MMDETNLRWCQNASVVDREAYQRAYRGPLPLTPAADRLLLGYDCTQSVDVSNVQIAVLGHSKKQFDTIQDRPYLKKIYLDDLDLGVYHKQFQSNYFSESRAFLCDDLFDDDAKYVGVVTASWNIKYQGLNPIDKFHNWRSAKALLLSKRDNVLLCADTNNPLAWFGTYSGGGATNAHDDRNIFSGLGFNGRQIKLIKKLIDSLKLKTTANPTANSNQFICHRNLYNRYIRFFRDNEVLPKVTKLWKNHDMVTSNPNTNKRPVGYVIECVSMMWLTSQEDVLVIPNEVRAGSWYKADTCWNALGGDAE